MLKAYREMIDNKALEEIVNNIKSTINKLKEVNEIISYYKSQFDEEKILNSQEELNKTSYLINNL